MVFENLASYKRCANRITECWPSFLKLRAERLRQQERHGVAAEKVAENIIEDLFTQVLDWSVGDLNNQLEYADLVLTKLGLKRLLLEIKRPGSLAWNVHAVERALGQARRYADEQRVKCIGVSDGYMLYAADIVHGGVQDRAFVSLENRDAPLELWWLSVDGIYRERSSPSGAALSLLPRAETVEATVAADLGGSLLHAKYHLPAACFAYVGNASDPRTWHLPYLQDDLSVDSKRLPKAIQAIVSNYRGARVISIPEDAIPDVLVRLAVAAARAGKLPFQSGEGGSVYVQLVEVLNQLALMDRVNAEGLG
jgi:hypothetical protein